MTVRVAVVLSLVILGCGDPVVSGTIGPFEDFRRVEASRADQDGGRSQRTVAVGQQGLTGTWTAENGATYQIRTAGTDVFWFGGNRGQGHVFHGLMSNDDELTGRWADVPPEPARNTGLVRLLIVSDDELRVTGSAVAHLGQVFRRAQ